MRYSILKTITLRFIMAQIIIQVTLTLERAEISTKAGTLIQKEHLRP